MSVPARELNGIVLGVSKAKELVEGLQISQHKVFLHTDSTINMH